MAQRSAHGCEFDSLCRCRFGKSIMYMIVVLNVMNILCVDLKKIAFVSEIKSQIFID